VVNTLTVISINDGLLSTSTGCKLSFSLTLYDDCSNFTLGAVNDKTHKERKHIFIYI